jgi:hypothetical protein
MRCETPLTIGDSSLSPGIQSVAAAELGYGDLAYAYFLRTVRMDLDDVNGNVANGVHVAAWPARGSPSFLGSPGSVTTADAPTSLRDHRMPGGGSVSGG